MYKMVKHWLINLPKITSWLTGKLHWHDMILPQEQCSLPHGLTQHTTTTGSVTATEKVYKSAKQTWH